MAKHWKQLVQKETATKKSELEEENEFETIPFTDLVKPTTEDTSLEDIAASNINLKGLLEEQKELEQNMNALTGKTEEHSKTNKQYDTAIKSVYQKRKEERKAEEKKKKLLKKRKHKINELNRFAKKEKNTFSVDTIPKKSKQKKTHKKDFLKTQKRVQEFPLKSFEKVKKTTKNISKIEANTLKKATRLNKNLTTVSKKIGALKTENKDLQKLGTTLNTASTLINKGTSLVNDISKGLKKLDNTVDTISKSTKKGSTITTTISEKLNNLKSVTSEDLNSKVTTLKNLTKPVENKSFTETLKTAETISKKIDTVINVFNKTDDKKTELIDKFNSLTKKENGFKNPLPNLKTSTTNTNTLSEKLNKVNTFYKNSKTHLDKTAKTVDGIFNKTDQIKKSEKKEKALMALNSLDKIFSKKEEKTSKGFDTINVTEIFSAAKKIKEFADELPTKKKSVSKKDPFSL